MKGKVGPAEQDFREIFRLMLHGFLPFSSVFLTELSSFWHGFEKISSLYTN